MTPERIGTAADTLVERALKAPPVGELLGMSGAFRELLRRESVARILRDPTILDALDGDAKPPISPQ